MPIYLHLLEMKGISFENFIPRISFISWRFLVLTERISAISGQSAKHIQSRDRYCYDKHGKIRWLMQLDNLQLKTSAGQKIIPKIHLIYNLLPIKKQPMNRNLENFHENPRPPWKGHCISPNPRCVASYFPEALSRTIGRRPRLPQPQWHPTSPRMRLAKGRPTPGMANNREKKKTFKKPKMTFFGTNKWFRSPIFFWNQQILLPMMIWFLETASLVWKSCVSHVVPRNHEKPRRFQQPWWEENFHTWELKTQYPIGVGNWRKKGLQEVFNKSFTMKLKRRLKILLKLPLKHGFYSSLTLGIRTNSKSINETNPIKIRSPLLASKITILAKVFFFLDFWWLHSCSVKRAAKMAEVRLRVENTADVHKPIRRILIKNHVDHFWPLQNVCAKSLRKKRTNPWIFFQRCSWKWASIGVIF